MRRPCPLPLVQGLVLSRSISEDRRTGEFSLVGPFNAIALNFFPAGFRFALSFFLCNGHGAYALDLEVRDAGGDTAWRGGWGRVIHCPDPLTPHHEVVHDVVAVFPHTGRFDLVLVANGEDLARYALLVTDARQG